MGYSYGSAILVIAFVLAVLIGGYIFDLLINRRNLLREREDLQAILPVSTGAVKKEVQTRLDQIQGLL